MDRSIARHCSVYNLIAMVTWSTRSRHPRRGGKLFAGTFTPAHLFLCIFFGICLFSCPLPVHANEIFVSPRGNDNAGGSLLSPVLTLEKAVRLSRSLRSRGFDRITIYMRAGVYHHPSTLQLDARDNGLTISAYPGEEVILDGSRSIPLSLLSGIQLAHPDHSLPIDAYQVDLSRLKIPYGNIRNVGFARPYGSSWGELFINGRAYHLARWPNRGMIPMGRVLDPGAIPRDMDFSNRGGIISYDSVRINRWQKEREPWMSGYFKWGYADDMVRIAAIDTVHKTIRTASAAMYGYGSGAVYQQWYGVNLLSELDCPGEFYLDRQSGMMRFIADSAVTSVKYSVLEGPFLTLEDAAHLTIRGIGFTASRGMGISMVNTEDVIIEGCTFYNLGSLGINMGLGIRAFDHYSHEGTGIPVKHQIGNLQQHLYTNTAFDRKAGHNNIIRHCTFRQLGSGGISMGGGNRHTLSAGGNVVENCLFSDLNRIEKTYRPAIHITGVGNTVRHCEISDLPSMAILVHGNDHLIEYNYIHDVVLQVDDLGAVYYGRDVTERGHMVRYNYFENIPDRLATCAIYHDDGACGMTVYGNVFYKAGRWVSLIGGGSDNIYENNIFIGSKMGIHIDNRLANWGREFMEPGGLFEKRIDVLYFENSALKNRYPHLKKFLKDGFTPSGNRIEKNAFFQIDSLIDGDKSWLEGLAHNFSGDAVSGFKNPSDLNFNLSDNSPVFTEIPGFKAIPFYKMGLYESGFRKYMRLRNGLLTSQK